MSYQAADLTPAPTVSQQDQTDTNASGLDSAASQFLQTTSQIAPYLAYSYMARKSAGAGRKMKGKREISQVGLTAKDLYAGHGPPPMKRSGGMSDLTRSKASFAPLIGKATASSWMQRAKGEFSTALKRGENMYNRAVNPLKAAATREAAKVTKKIGTGVQALQTSLKTQAAERAAKAASKPPKQSFMKALQSSKTAAQLDARPKNKSQKLETLMNAKYRKPVKL